MKKMPKNPEHSWWTKQVLKALERLLPAGWTWRNERPVRIPAHDEPEPDVSIVRGSDDDYMHRKPGPADVGLLVEVSESTLSTDRGEKRRVYARAAIPNYWIVNLVDRQVEVYTNPGVDDYTTRQDFSRPASPLVIDGQQLGQIAVDDVLPLVHQRFPEKAGNEGGSRGAGLRTRWGVERNRPPVMRSSMPPILQTNEPGTGGAETHRDLEEAALPACLAQGSATARRAGTPAVSPLTSMIGMCEKSLVRPVSLSPPWRKRM